MANLDGRIRFSSQTGKVGVNVKLSPIDTASERYVQSRHKQAGYISRGLILSLQSLHLIQHSERTRRLPFFAPKHIAFAFLNAQNRIRPQSKRQRCGGRECGGSQCHCETVDHVDCGTVDAAPAGEVSCGVVGCIVESCGAVSLAPGLVHCPIFPAIVASDASTCLVRSSRDGRMDKPADPAEGNAHKKMNETKYDPVRSSPDGRTDTHTYTMTYMNKMIVRSGPV